MKELAEQAATGTYTTAQREIMNSEFQAMAAEIDRIANATDFNGVKLLDGSLATEHAGSGMKIHFGTGNNASEDYYFIKIEDMRATESTGLQVGNSDPNDVLRTTSLNASSATAVLKNSASSTDGLFGIRYTENFNAESPAGASWTVFGYVTVDASRDSIQDIVDRINKGRAATGTLTLASLSSANYSGQNLTINGVVISFTTATAGTISYDDTNKTATVGVGNGAAISGTSVANAVADLLNTYAASIGVYAVSNGSTSALTLYAYEFGSDGNNINTASLTTYFTVGQSYLSGGGYTPIEASVYYDETNNEYELQLEMVQGGEKYQLQIFTLTTAGGTPSVVGGAITGTSATVLKNYAVLPTNINASTAKSTYATVDESDEWTQVQNGSGLTNWNAKDILTQTQAQLALSGIDEAIKKKDQARANLGAIQNRLENTITNLQIQAENLQAAESRISDVDVATEMTEFTRNNILAQAATAMLAQANSLPMLALTLLGG
jgi:flagellin